MSKPHAGLHHLNSYDRFERGGRIVDLQCSACLRVWKEVNCCDIESKPTSCCDECEQISRQVWRELDFAWESLRHSAFHYSKRTKNTGIYGWRDDLFYHRVGREKLSKHRIEALALSGITAGEFQHTKYHEPSNS